jgi:SAM-dependent methyltransferase
LAEFWESRYADADRIWSGRVNQTLAALTSELPPGRALDLGCGEGADAIWLASRGWQVTGVDISATALARAAEAAADAGVDGRIEWVGHDLASWGADGMYDLVSASFFHSPVDIPRPDILSRAAGRVAGGGRLLIVSHADFPPWSSGHEGHEYHFLTAAEEIDQLALDLEAWDVEIAETRSRAATGPDGQEAVLDDVVVLLRRH